MFKNATIFILILASGVCCGANIVKNGDFEEVTGNLPDNWHTDTYADTYGSEKRGVRFYVQKGNAYSGEYCAVIENIHAEDSKFIQESLSLKKRECLKRTGSFIWMK